MGRTASTFAPRLTMNQIFTRSGFRSASRRTSARASSATLMIGGSSVWSAGGAYEETSGPATATRGAASALRASSRTSKFHIGPPTSTVAVTPLRSRRRKVAGSRSRMPFSSSAYGTFARRSITSGRV